MNVGIMFKVATVSAVAVALASQAPAIAQAHAPSAPLLLAHARRLNRDSLPISPDTHSFAQHFWLSPRAVLLAYKDPGDHVEVRRLDVRTGLLSRVHGLGPGLDGEPWVWHGTLTPIALSPDHRWLLGTRDTVAAATYEAVGVSNGRREVWPAGYDYTWDLFWLPDGSWLTWGQKGLSVYLLGRPRPTSDVPISLPVSPPYGPSQQSEETDLLGADRRGRVLLLVGSILDEFGGTATVYSLSPSRSGAARRLATFRLPNTVAPYEVVLSPGADQLAWICHDDAAPKDMGDVEQAGYSVWVSGLNGRHLREIGHTPRGKTALDFYSLAWTPDGRQLSFLYQNNLWSVPIAAAPTRRQRHATVRPSASSALRPSVWRIGMKAPRGWTCAAWRGNCLAPQRGASTTTIELLVRTAQDFGGRSVYCQAGGRTMRYQIRQRVFSLGGAFDITDDGGNAAYRVQGEVLSLGNALNLYDAQGQPLAHIQQRLLSWTPTYDITRGGAPALTVHKQAFSWNPHFDAEGPAGMYTMDGDWTDWNFQVDSGGQTVAWISRQFALFSDCYGVEVVEGGDTPTVLCLAIVMDEIVNSQ